MNQIRFKTGEFQEYTATKTFELSTFGVKIQKGSEIEFDGSVVKYAGAQHQFPQFRSAVIAGWAVLSSEYDAANPLYNAPQSANIKMRPVSDADKSGGKTAATTIEADERIVMSSAQHAEATRTQNRPNHSTRLAGNSGVAEAQDGVPVRSLKTAAKNKTSLADAGAAMRAADSVTIEPGQGITEQEMLEQMSATDRAVYLAQKSALKSRYVDDAAPSTGVKVGEVKSAGTKHADGMKLTQSVGGGTEISDGTGVAVATIRKDETATRVEDGITFKNTNGPKQHAAPMHPRTASETMNGTVSARLQVARALCPEFPESYDFAASEKKKLARLQADFEDRPDVLRAVFAAESDDFKQKLVAEFPQAFQG